MKWLKAVMWLLVMGFTAPMLKSFFDGLTDPVTGIMVTSGTCPDYLIALTGAIPFLWPLGVIIGIIIMLSRPDKPKEPRLPRGRGGNEEDIWQI